MQSTNKRSPIFTLTTIALAAAALCVLSPWSIPVGVIPITFATLGVYLCAATLGAGRGTLATLLYLAIGFVGAPVFSGFLGGVGVLLSPTGGFLLGYLPCATIVGISKYHRKPWLLLVLLVLGTLVCYTLGILWFCLSSGTPFPAALFVSVLPFLPLDALKIVAAFFLAPPLRRALIHSNP